MAGNYGQPVQEELVNIELSGGKTILPEKTVVTARRTQTWREVFNTQLGMSIPDGQGDEILVCTTNYCPTKPTAGRGHKAALDETVGDFMNGFKMNLRQPQGKIYWPPSISKAWAAAAQAHRMGVIASLFPPNAIVVPPEPGRRRDWTDHRSVPHVTPEPASVSVRLQPEPIITRERIPSGVKRHRLNSDSRIGGRNLSHIKTEPASPDQREESSDEDVDGCPRDDDTVAELAQQGIQMKDLKTRMGVNLSRMDNNLLLRVENEVNCLKRRNTWLRNVGRAPLTCWLVQELLQ